jgi:UrcA family protein
MSSKYLQAISASFGLFSLGAAMAASGVAPIALEAAPASRTVSYADLNLASPEGVRQLKGRVHKAAREVCTTMGYKPLTEIWAERACMRGAIKGASGEIELAVARFERQRYARAKSIEIAARR